MLRGLSMLLVIWGHIAKSERLFFLLTGPFKMPMFFAITGYVFNDRNGDAYQFFKNLFLKIVIPWVVLSLIWLKIIYAFIICEPGRISDYIFSFISGKTLWFMPCCIISECIYFFVRKFIKREKMQYCVLGAISVIGLFLAKYQIARFGMIDVACVSQCFIMFGLWYKNNEEKLKEKIGPRSICSLIIGYAVLIVISRLLYPGKTIDVHNNSYYNLLLCGMLVFFSLLVLFSVAPNIKKCPKWLVFVGQNTLIFYIGHYTARTLLDKILIIMRISLPKGLIGYMITMIFICVAMSVTAIILNRWFPFFVGKKHIKTIQIKD